MQAIKKAAALSVLAVAGIGTAQAAIVSPATPGGSEVILSIVNNSTNDSISIDLNTTMGTLATGNNFALSPEAQAFIAGAGGLGGVSYGIIAGDTSDFLTNVFLTSSVADLSTKQVANATKGAWGNSIIQLTGNLNSGSPSNETYGPYDDAISSPNYITGGHFDWQTGDGQLNTLALGTQSLNLFQYTMTGFVGLTAGQEILAPAQLSETSLSIVPVPAAVWLFGSALAGLFGARRFKK